MLNSDGLAPSTARMVGVTLSRTWALDTVMWKISRGWKKEKPYRSLYLVLNVVEGKKFVKKTNIALSFVLDGREIKD
jgi:hypothetical protein